MIDIRYPALASPYIDATLDSTLASRGIVFRSPPLTAQLVSAIKLISPHLAILADAPSRVRWERDQNGSCWGEYEALAQVIGALEPARILEIGPGLGRSAVFFQKKFGWDPSYLHLFDGEGTRTRYTKLGARFEDSFCGSLAALSDLLSYNGLQNVRIFDASQHTLCSLPGPYDLVYSFYGVGYHWAIDHFLEDISILMHSNSLGLFTVPSDYAPGGFHGFSSLEINQKAVWPKDTWLKLLLLRKR